MTIYDAHGREVYARPPPTRIPSSGHPSAGTPLLPWVLGVVAVWVIVSTVVALVSP